MRKYYRIMPGRKSVHGTDCFAGGFIGTDFGIHQDLSASLPDQWRTFNKEFIPVYLSRNPDKSRVAAGLACGAIWTVSKGIGKGDLILSPDGTGIYRVGEVVGEYYYSHGEILPHRRKIRWLDEAITRSAMSEALQNSTGSIGTVADISDHRAEIESLLGR